MPLMMMTDQLEYPGDNSCTADGSKRARRENTASDSTAKTLSLPTSTCPYTRPRRLSLCDGAAAVLVSRRGSSSTKDRHSKVVTAKGIARDRRVRLSVPTAIRFYDIQDRLGVDQPSKAIDWLMRAAQHAINQLPTLHTIISSQPPRASPSHTVSTLPTFRTIPSLYSNSSSPLSSASPQFHNLQAESTDQYDTHAHHMPRSAHSPSYTLASHLSLINHHQSSLSSNTQSPSDSLASHLSDPVAPSDTNDYASDSHVILKCASLQTNGTYGSNSLNQTSPALAPSNSLRINPSTASNNLSDNCPLLNHALRPNPKINSALNNINVSVYNHASPTLNINHALITSLNDLHQTSPSNLPCASNLISIPSDTLCSPALQAQQKLILLQNWLLQDHLQPFDTSKTAQDSLGQGADPTLHVNDSINITQTSPFCALSSIFDVETEDVKACATEHNDGPHNFA